MIQHLQLLLLRLTIMMVCLGWADAAFHSLWTVPQTWGATTASPTFPAAPFAVPPQLHQSQCRRPASHQLFIHRRGRNQDNNNNSKNNEEKIEKEYETELARQALEKFFYQDPTIPSQIFTATTGGDDAAGAGSTPPLTSVERQRRQVELQLIDSLRESDDALDELMHLWITERDAESATMILQMQESCSKGLVEEEWALREMMTRYPTWAEPVIRFATVLYYKGRTEESYEVALQALRLKPWHYEAPQLLVLLALRVQDRVQALFWARRGLPPLRGETSEEQRLAETSTSMGGMGPGGSHRTIASPGTGTEGLHYE